MVVQTVPAATVVCIVTQSFLRGWAGRVEQFASGSSSRGQSTLF